MKHYIHELLTQTGFLINAKRILMQIKIIDLLSGDGLFEKEYPEEFISSKGIEESESSFSYHSGEIQISENWFGGIQILYIEIYPIKPGVLLFETDTPLFMMKFCIDGCLNCTCPEKNFNIELHSQKCVYLPIPACSMENELTEHCKLFFIFLSEKCYNRLIPDQLFLQEVMIAKINPPIQLILNSILACRYTGTMKRIFMETQVLQLLLLQLERQKTVALSHSEPFLREYDIRRVREARSLIEENIKTPCSLIELAHKVGLNDFKLKKGFKELFGTTVFGHLNELRMQEAKRLLTEEKRPVNYVSNKVGYKNSHHFSAAFKKRYGILPSQLNR